MTAASWTVGPQQVGGRYFCGYWQDEYTVTVIDGEWLTCEWSDGHVTRHCTPWDDRRDRIVSEPCPSDAERLSRPCDGCGAEPAEECRPMCLGQAAAQDAAEHDAALGVTG